MTAICKHCEQDMATADGCTEGNVGYADGVQMPPVPWTGGDHRCPDCNSLPGHLHHLNCDQERCPRCGGHLLGCDCGEPAETLH